MILSVIDRISQIFKYKFLPEKQSDQLKLPKWVNVSRKRFNEILSTVTEAKNNVLKASIDGREITLDKAESLLKAINKEKINGSEFKKKVQQYCWWCKNNTTEPMLTRSQDKM